MNRHHPKPHLSPFTFGQKSGPPPKDDPEVRKVKDAKIREWLERKAKEQK